VGIPNLAKLFAGEDIFVRLPRRFLVERLDRADFSKSTYFHYLSTRTVPLQVILKKCTKYEAWQAAEAFCSRSKPAVRIPKEMDFELAYLTGALRDGANSMRDSVEYTVSLFQSGEGSYVWLRKMASIFRREFGVAPKIEADRDGHRVLIHSKPVALFFKGAFEMPKDQRLWDTPKAIKNLPTTEIVKTNGYVAGFFDAEGYVTSIETFRKTGKAKLAFSQNNRESLEFIRDVLEMQGFRPHIYADRGKFVLCLYGKDELRRFYVHIPILRKKKRLSSLLNSF